MRFATVLLALLFSGCGGNDTSSGQGPRAPYTPVPGTGGVSGTPAPTSTATATASNSGAPPPPPAPTATGTATPTATSTAEPPPPAPTGTSEPPGPPPVVHPSVTIQSVQFTVNPGQEVFKCQNFKNPLGKDIAIVQSESVMAPGSHHMFLFREPTVIADSGAVEDCSGVEFRDYVHLAQRPDVTWTYPDGVGRLLKSNDGLRLAVHYLNTTPEPVVGQISVKLSYVEPSEVKYLAAPIFLNQTLLVVPPGKSTASRQFVTPYSIQMLRAVGHMHARGTHITATTSAGQTLYDAKTWSEPQENVFEPTMTIPAGTTITWSCDYENTGSLIYTFGESANTNEMCIIYGLFYPTDAGANQGVSLGGLL